MERLFFNSDSKPCGAALGSYTVMHQMKVADQAISAVLIGQDWRDDDPVGER